MHIFEVHSNERACRKKVRLGLEQVNNWEGYNLGVHSSLVTRFHITLAFKNETRAVQASKSVGYTRQDEILLSFGVHSFAEKLHCD